MPVVRSVSSGLGSRPVFKPPRPPRQHIPASRKQKTLRIIVLLLTVLGLYAYLWNEWIHMQWNSTKAPAEQLLFSSMQRARTAVYDYLKHAVLVVDTLCKPRSYARRH